MKTFKLFLLLFFAITISCKEKKTATLKNITTTVKHFICANKCEGSGGAIAGNCPTCNTPYLHNQAFHNDEFLKSGPLNVPKTDVNTNPVKNTSISPAQNASGVYHYTCPNGCYGGAGTAAKCTTCGTDLAHNQAYHN
ncbi:MAG: hypothetical protein COC16_04715 [Lutibacter sp.]|nr:MAG: hypothetical protein COC16_04715 [Lutibacter sp.]